MVGDEVALEAVVGSVAVAVRCEALAALRSVDAALVVRHSEVAEALHEGVAHSAIAALLVTLVTEEVVAAPAALVVAAEIVAASVVVVVDSAIVVLLVTALALVVGAAVVAFNDVLCSTFHFKVARKTHFTCG